MAARSFAFAASGLSVASELRKTCDLSIGPHHGEQPLQRSQRHVRREAEDAEIDPRIDARQRGQAERVGEQDGGIAPDRPALAHPRGEPALFQSQ